MPSTRSLGQQKCSRTIVRNSVELSGGAACGAVWGSEVWGPLIADRTEGSPAGAAALIPP